MRIFFLSYAHEAGLVADAGGFRKLWELARALAERDHEVTVLYPRLPGHRPLRQVPSRSYPVLDLPYLRPLTAYLGMFVQAWVLGRGWRPDVVYFRSGTNVLPLALARLLGAAAVVEVNADTVGFHRAEGAPGLRIRVGRALESLNARRSDAIVALTPGLKRMLTTRYGIPPAKVRVIPSGTDVLHFAPADPAAARRRLGLDVACVVVGFVGLFYRHQGVPTLLEAMARERAVVASDLPSVRELARDSGAITLVPPDDPDALAAALETLLADPDRRRALARRGRAFVMARHGWDKIGTVLAATLAELAGRRDTR